MDKLIYRIIDPVDPNQGGKKSNIFPDRKERMVLKDLGLYK